jgi:ABC-type antimicrobial peptide transport system permease subunit
VLSIASGIALALAIITASNGVDEQVKNWLNIPLPPQINLNNIHNVLDQTRDMLTWLSYIFTSVLIAIITWITMSSRRREIGLARQNGFHTMEVLIQLCVEAAILCIIGGFIGIGLSILLCNGIHQAIPLLPMHSKIQDIVAIFPIVTLLSFVTTTIIASYFAIRTYTDVI